MLINIINDFRFSILNKIYYKRLFNFVLILNTCDVDHERLMHILDMKKFVYCLYLKGIFLFNREQILIIASYLNIDPNDVYKIKIV